MCNPLCTVRFELCMSDRERIAIRESDSRGYEHKPVHSRIILPGLVVKSEHFNDQSNVIEMSFILYRRSKFHPYPVLCYRIAMLSAVVSICQEQYRSPCTECND